MKRDELKQLHQADQATLQQKLATIKRQLAKAKLELQAGQLEDTNLPAKLADDIARIKTILREKQLLAQAKQQVKQAVKAPDKQT
jgi:large subunit ribosomal protein L29